MNFAIVIGISDYRDKPLQGPVGDALAIREWLTSATGGNVPPENVALLTSTPDNEVALDHHIDLAINDLIERGRAVRKEYNRLYLYFSGHGIGVTFYGTALCLRLWPKLPHSTISTVAYIDGLANIGLFDEIIIFLDCCREYDLFTGSKMPGFDHRVRVGTKRPKLFVAYSTTYGQLSYEVDVSKTMGDPNAKQGAFTKFLLESLKGDADADEDGKIYAEDLIRHMTDNFRSFAERFQKIQESDYEVKSGGDKILLCTLGEKKVSNGQLETLNAPNYVLKFNRAGLMELRDGLERKVRDGNVAVGDVWNVFLEKGMSRIIDMGTKEFKVLMNFNQQTTTHDEF